MYRIIRQNKCFVKNIYDVSLENILKVRFNNSKQKLQFMNLKEQKS